MATNEIENEQWSGFLDNFSKEHQGKSASVQIFGAGTGSHREVRHLPFVGVSLDKKGSGDGSITIMMGTEAADHIEHNISHPTTVWLDSGADGGDEVLEIRSSDGNNLLLRFARS